MRMDCFCPLPIVMRIPAFSTLIIICNSFWRGPITKGGRRIVTGKLVLQDKTAVSASSLLLPYQSSGLQGALSSGYRPGPESPAAETLETKTKRLIDSAFFSQAASRSLVYTVLTL